MNTEADKTLSHSLFDIETGLWVNFDVLYAVRDWETDYIKQTFQTSLALTCIRRFNLAYNLLTEQNWNSEN